MAMFNLRCSDSNGRPIKDETPIKDEDESNFESKFEVWCVCYKYRSKVKSISSFFEFFHV